jgi:hypothetical protein
MAIAVLVNLQMLQLRYWLAKYLPVVAQPVSFNQIV